MLELDGLTKRYGSLVALDAVSATFQAGEVHAVLGENGAGKSTLVSLIAGFVQADNGTIRLDGKPIPSGNPMACKRLGIEMIHQHFTLIPAFTVRENLALGRLGTLWGRLSLRDQAASSLAVAARLGWEIDPEAKIKDLPVGVQQRIEILKALGGDAKVIIFDEPTAVLSPEEVAELIGTLHKLRDEGKIVILIAHKLSEVMSAADRVTVLRRGNWVASAAKGEFTSEKLAEWMVGEVPNLERTSSDTTFEGSLKVRDLVVNGDRGAEAVRKVSFEVQRGQILGIGGVDGNGQLELAEALAGIRSSSSGTVEFDAEIDGDPKVAYIPQDRHDDGLALGMSILDNLLITGFRERELTTGPFLSIRRVFAWAQGLIERFKIKASGPRERISALSGGNQQKVVVSRSLYRIPDLLIAASPTRGLDFRSTEYVQNQIRSAKEAGAVVVLFSTDLDELSLLADRVLFLSRGELVEASGAASLVGGKSA